MTGAGTRISRTGPELIARAREIAGIDIIDTEAFEPLDVLLASLNGESRLHADGAVAMEHKLLRLLTNRLRMQRDLAAHPEIHDQQIRPPLIIFGLARSGTTKLQKMLAASEDFNWWPLWQVLNPSLHSGSRDESPQARIDDAAAFAAWYARTSPEAMIGHEYATFEPEEECMVLEHTLCTPVFFGFSVVNDYLKWVMTQDVRSSFVFLRDTIKYLQWQGVADPTKRWILKCPMYHGMADVVLDVFAGADVVMMHRDPAANVPSWLRLADGLYRSFSDRTVDATQQARGMAGGIRRHLRLRTEHPEWHILDVAFRDLVASSQDVAERVYAHAGETLTEGARERMRAWEGDNPQHKRGRHTYALEDYGLTEAGISETFADYLAFQADLT